MNPHVRSYVQVGIAASALGLWSLFLRPAHVPPLWSALIALCVVGAAAGALLLIGRASSLTSGWNRQRCDFASLFLLAVCASANAILYFKAISTTSVAVAVLSHCLVPVLITVAAPWVLGTLRQTRSLLLAVMALIGLALMLEPWRFGSSSATDGLRGVVWGGSAALFNAGYLLISKRVAHRFGVEEQVVYQTVFALPLLFAMALMFPPPPPTLSGAIRVAAGAATVGVLGVLLLLRGLRHMSAEHAGFLTLLEPLTASFVAWIMWDERLGTLGVFGAALVVVSVVVALWSTGSSPTTVPVRSSGRHPRQPVSKL